MSSSTYRVTVDAVDGPNVTLRFVAYDTIRDISPSLVVMALDDLASECWLPTFEAAGLNFDDLDEIVARAQEIVGHVEVISSEVLAAFQDIVNGPQCVRVKFHSEALAGELPTGRSWDSVCFDGAAQLAFRARRGMPAKADRAQPELPSLAPMDDETFVALLDENPNTNLATSLQGIAACNCVAELIANVLCDARRLVIRNLGTFYYLPGAVRTNVTAKLRFGPQWRASTVLGVVEAWPPRETPFVPGLSNELVNGALNRVWGTAFAALRSGHSSVSMPGLGTITRTNHATGPRDRFVAHALLRQQLRPDDRYGNET